MNCTILVIEDEPDIAEIIAVNLKHEGHNVFRVTDALQAERLIKTKLPDLILLDWMLPGTDGNTFAKKLRSDDRTKSIPLIMITARSSEEDKIQGLESGADDYITKPFSIKELNARIQALLRRRSPELTKDIVESCGIFLCPNSRQVDINKEKISMGPTEFKLLHFFLTHPERVHTRAKILDHVWGDHVFVEERTVDVHIRRLRRALIPSSHSKYIETIRGTGYRFTKNPAECQKTK